MLWNLVHIKDTPHPHLLLKFQPKICKYPVTHTCLKFLCYQKTYARPLGIKGQNKHNLNQFMASQKLHYKCFKWIFYAIFSPSFSVFEAHFQEPSILENQWIPLHKILNRKFIIIHFKIRFLMLKLDFKMRIFQKYKLLKIAFW